MKRWGGREYSFECQYHKIYIVIISRFKYVLCTVIQILTYYYNMIWGREKGEELRNHSTTKNVSLSLSVLPSYRQFYFHRLLRCGRRVWQWVNVEVVFFCPSVFEVVFFCPTECMRMKVHFQQIHNEQIIVCVYIYIYIALSNSHGWFCMNWSLLFFMLQVCMHIFYYNLNNCWIWTCDFVWLQHNREYIIYLVNNYICLYGIKWFVQCIIPPQKNRSWC